MSVLDKCREGRESAGWGRMDEVKERAARLARASSGIKVLFPIVLAARRAAEGRAPRS